MSVAPDEKRYSIHKQRQDHKLTRDLHVRRVEEPHPDPVGTIGNWSPEPAVLIQRAPETVLG
jgi:hypothetical protein